MSPSEAWHRESQELAKASLTRETVARQNLAEDKDNSTRAMAHEEMFKRWTVDEGPNVYTLEQSPVEFQLTNRCCICDNKLGKARLKPRHHCRECGQSCCTAHSRKKILLKHRGGSKKKRVCDQVSTHVLRVVGTYMYQDAPSVGAGALNAYHVCRSASRCAGE